MFIKMIGLYGMENQKAWYRKNGDCYDFSSDKKFASNLNKEEADRIMSYKDWYCNQYNAEMMIIEETR